jgi:hypothetical protein
VYWGFAGVGASPGSDRSAESVYTGGESEKGFLPGVSKHAGHSHEAATAVYAASICCRRFAVSGVVRLKTLERGASPGSDLNGINIFVSSVLPTVKHRYRTAAGKVR